MAPSNRDDTSVDIKALMEKTVRDILGGGSLLSVNSCIFRVPEVLRRYNTKAYHPDMVAIGPLHDRKQEQYQRMEKAKWWYLHEYILSPNSKNMDLANLIEVVTRDEELALSCYAESLDYSNKPNEFREIMILDGCFIVELFRKFIYKKKKRSDGSQPKKNDPILSMDCMIQYICHDILLLENQLPWFVLQNLYSHTKGNLDDENVSLSELILDVFSFLPSVGNNCKAYLSYICHYGDKDANYKHVLDLIRTSIVCSFNKGNEPLVPSNDGERYPRVPPNERYLGVSSNDGEKAIPPATTLSKGGVKFKRAIQGGESIMSMKFIKGELRIPQLEIGELTETLFRNLIAFEQCSENHPDEITSYAALMDKLISSKEDMEFLCEKKIIRNWLSAEDGFEFFNKLYKDTFLYEFYYDGLCTKVNSYYNVKCVRWMAIFWREYFHTPWTIISLLAAAFLLVLTLVQTIFTVHE